jgi:hypothetical protein
MDLLQQRMVLDHEGQRKGVVYRNPYAHSKKTDSESNNAETRFLRNFPKDINVIDEEWVMLHFPSPLRSRSVILVEDIPSANKMDKFYPCVALLGTNLNDKKLDYLLSLGINHVIIALDNDATRKAIKLAKKFMINTSILPLQKDLKDQTDEQLQEIARRLSE